jgi:LacI family transcriptional regulator
MATLPVTLTETITLTLPGYLYVLWSSLVAVSIKDLARLAGVSVATVARALKDKPDIKSETKKRVLELAREHNYQPNILARSLVTSRTFAVGIIVPDLTNPFFPALIKGIEKTLWEAGYSVILADTDFDTEKEVETVSEFLNRRVDGLIMSPIESQDYRKWIGSIRAAELPFVSLIRLRDHVADTVVAADRYGARMAVDHLLDLGRNQILYLGNAASHWGNEERAAGYREALRNAGVRLDEGLIHSVAVGTIESAAKRMKELLAENMQFDAVLAFDDIMAIGVKRALNEAGRRIPDDVALVGFDNIELSTLPEISLTTVDIPKYELGRVSAQLVIERIEEAAEGKGDDTTLTRPFKEIVLNPTLIKRASTMGGYAVP